MIPLKDNIPTRATPYVTIALIAINVLVYLFVQHGFINSPSDSSVVKYGLIPYELTHPGKQCVPSSSGDIVCGPSAEIDRAVGEKLPNTYLTLLTSMFMHGGFLHIAGNMLFLWVFGNNIEDSMRKWKFLIFYLLGGLAASLAQVAVHPDATAPGIGASGAIAAVLGGYAILYPRARVITAVILIFFITLLELPALLVLGAWFFLQLLDAALNSPLNGGGVAYFAHIGGFLFGLLLIKLFADRPHRDYFQPRLPVY